MSETKKLRFLGGTHISRAAQELVDAVAAGAEAAEASFNDITLRAVKGTTVSEIEQQYDTASTARAEAYEASPQGRAAKAKAIIERQSQQEQADALMAELPALDFASDVAVLDWLNRFQGPSDHGGVNVDRAAVVKAFTDHGYKPSVNLGDDFNENDRDNYTRYLVGQALSMLQSVGAIHGIFGTFHERWKAKFIAPTA